MAAEVARKLEAGVVPLAGAEPTNPPSACCRDCTYLTASLSSGSARITAGTRNRKNTMRRRMGNSPWLAATRRVSGEERLARDAASGSESRLTGFRSKRFHDRLVRGQKRAFNQVNAIRYGGKHGQQTI